MKWDEMKWFVLGVAGYAALAIGVAMYVAWLVSP